MGKPVTSDPFLSGRAGTLRTLLNSGFYLRLFQLPLVIDPTTPLSSLVEATFGGYVGYNLAGLWSPVTQVQPGQWTFSAGPFTFAYAAPPTGQVAGWYLSDGVQWAMAQAFAAPLIMDVGVSFQLNVGPQEYSLSLLT